MADTLDRSKPYNTVHGDFYNARYFQSGKYFGPQGERIIVPGDPQWTVAPVTRPEPSVTDTSEGTSTSCAQTVDKTPHPGGRPRLGERPLSKTERQRRWRAKRKEGAP